MFRNLRLFFIKLILNKEFVIFVFTPLKKSLLSSSSADFISDKCVGLGETELWFFEMHKVKVRIKVKKLSFLKSSD